MEKPLEKCITDIMEIPDMDGKLYVSAVFNCYDQGSLSLAMADYMRVDLCVSTIRNAHKAFPSISTPYREELRRCGIVQSINSDGVKCHDNARCETMWARMKKEPLYGRYNTRKMKVEELKTFIWKCSIVYWNNWRICSANGGLPPILKRRQYYELSEHMA